MTPETHATPCATPRTTAPLNPDEQAAIRMRLARGWALLDDDGINRLNELAVQALTRAVEAEPGAAAERVETLWQHLDDDARRQIDQVVKDGLRRALEG